jgi:hypothetical protein
MRKGKRFLAGSVYTSDTPSEKPQGDGQVPLHAIKPTDRQIAAGRKELLPKKPKRVYLSCIQYKQTDRPRLRELLHLERKTIIQLSARINADREAQRDYRMVEAAGLERTAIVLKVTARDLERIVIFFENAVLLRAEELGLPPFRPRVKTNTALITDDEAKAEHLAQREKMIRRANIADEDRLLRQQAEDDAQAVKVYGVGNSHGEFKQSPNRTFQRRHTRAGFAQQIRSGKISGTLGEDSFDRQHDSKGVDFDHSDDSFFND